MRIAVAVSCVALLVWLARAPVAERSRAADPNAVRSVVPAALPESEEPVEVTGTVQDEDEGALAGATVSVFEIASLPPAWKTERIRWTISRAGALDPDPTVPDRLITRTSTDAEGRFRLALRRGARCAILVEAGDRVGVHHVEVTEPREMTFRVAPLVDKRIRVESARGEPLAGARLFVFEVGVLEPPRARFETDRDGTVTLALTESDALRVFAAGFAAGTVRNALDAPDLVVLHVARFVAGTVRDTAGRPLAGARVRIGQDADETRSLEDINEFPRHHAMSDTRGRFRVEGLLPEACDVFVDKPGFLEVRVPIWPDEPDAPFVLVRPATAEGVVVFADGRPAPRARVARSRADARGRFRVETLAPGPRRLRATIEKHEGAVHVDLSEGQIVTGLRIVLEPRSRSFVRLRILRHDGRPVRKDGSRKPREDGTFLRTFRDPPGTPVSFRVGGRLATSVSATTVADPEESEVLVRLPAPVPVTVVASGPRYAEFDVNGHAYGVASEGNRLSIEAHPHRNFWIAVTAAGFARETRTDLRAPEDGQPIVVAMRRADCAVTGTIAGADDLTIWGRVCNPGFRIDGLAPGPFDAIAQDARRIPRVRLRATLEPGRTADLGTVVVPPLRRVRGIVRDAGGAPVWQASVRIAGPQRLRPPSIHARRTRGDGSFELEVAPFPELYLVVQKEGHATALVDVADEPRVELGPPHGATVRVPAGLARAAPRLTRADGRAWRPRYRRTGDTIELHDLPAGRFRFDLKGFETTVPDTRTPVTTR